MEPKYYRKQIGIFFILSLVTVCQSDNCIDDRVALDEQYLACCMERPKYTSEPCIDVLLANHTFSQECLVDCLYREFEIFDGQSINLAAVKQFLDNQIPDEHFNNIYMRAFQRCSLLDRKKIADKFSFIKIKKSHKCDEYPTFMELCVWYYTIANCPEKYVSHDESCNIKREWIKECLFET